MPTASWRREGQMRHGDHSGRSAVPVVEWWSSVPPQRGVSTGDYRAGGEAVQVASPETLGPVPDPDVGRCTSERPQRDSLDAIAGRASRGLLGSRGACALNRPVSFGGAYRRMYFHRQKQGAINSMVASISFRRSVPAVL
ncbi:hypothetical protein HYQ46_001783 [Verticillium longisporum]|nr:hypothetical protein HYQ46_001783 [Verticillium longisporum]